MTSSPIKQVRFYKIGGFKQTDPHKNQNLNPFQFGYGNQYPFMFYPNQNQPMYHNNLTPKKQINTPPDQNNSDNKASKKVNQTDKRQPMIEEDDEIENQLETIQEENLVITRKKNPDMQKDEYLKEDKKPKEKEPPKIEKAKETTKEKEPTKIRDSNKVEEPAKAKEITKAKEPAKTIETVAKEKSNKIKQNDEDNLNTELDRKKKEVVEKYETIEKAKIETPRSKDGKPFSIRGTTKTVIEVTTTEIVDESIFKTKDDSTPKLVKKTPEVKKEIEDKKDQDPMDNSENIIENKQTKTEEAKDSDEKIVDSNDKNIQTDDDNIKNVKVDEIKRAKSFNKKVDKETETSEPKVDKFLDDEPSIDEKPRVKRKTKKPVEPSKPTDDEETPRQEKLRSRKDADGLVPKKRISHSLDDRKKIDPVKSDQDHKIGKSDYVKQRATHNNQFYLPVIKNLDKTQAKRLEKSKNDFKFPSLVTEKQAPHRFKLKFASNESVHNSYDGYKRCPCLMHKRRYYEKFGIPPDQEGDHSFQDHSNQRFENSFILSDRNGKYSQRNKTSLEKYLDGHFYQSLNQSFYSDSEMILRPPWNETF